MKRAAIVLGTLTLVACGRELVELAPTPPTDASTSSDGGRAPEAAVCAREGGTACRPLDGPCTADAECCSGRCEDGTCLPAGTCAGPSAPCSTRDACCSGRCEPIPGTTNRACTAPCRPTGSACTRGADCCSFGCHGGVCSDATCTPEGEACASPADCCSGVCDAGRCRIDGAALCRASGEDCNSGGGSGCCTACVQGRCDVGPGVCRPRGAPCGSGSDCCLGNCVAGFCGGACAADTAPCQSSADCCSGACSASPGVCVSAATRCALLGEACAADATCCSGQCLGGRCGDTCGDLR